MKFEIYNQEPDEPVVRLALKKEDDTIRLYVVDANGDVVKGGCILIVRPSGTIWRAGSVSPSLGFQIDDAGRVVML